MGYSDNHQIYIIFPREMGRGEMCMIRVKTTIRKERKRSCSVLSDSVQPYGL